MSKNDNASTFVDEVLKQLEKRLQQEPYQINLLEEVHMHDNGEKKELTGLKRKVCENAHTRILRRILNFKNKDGYVLLDSFINTVAEKCDSWNKISELIEHPEFIPEANCDNSSGRIDLLVKEKDKYAIIIENKINDAQDQENQIGRYIKHIQDEGFNLNQIYVLYLSSEGDEPKDGSWIFQGDNFKEKVAHYCNFSFRYDILPWIDNNALPLEKTFPEQKYLISATEQYVDYLQGRFGLRKREGRIIDSIISNSQKGELNERLRFLEDARKQVQVKLSTNKIAEETPTKHVAQLRILRERLYYAMLNILQKQIGENTYLNYHRHTISTTTGTRVVYCGKVLEAFNQRVLAYIGRSSNGEGYLFCSVISLFGEPLNERIKNRLGFLTNGKNDYRFSKHTNRSKEDNYSEAIGNLQQVLRILNDGA